ncbi:MAG: formate--tetrahydrofolate ligase [Planctomycetota bacterium]|jgi:formate--tetrahydrofolate ligase
MTKADDASVARKAKLKPIAEIAAQIGISAGHLEPYGPYKGKVGLGALDDLKGRKPGKYVAVTAMTPTPMGEGKTVNTIGLSLGLSRLGKRAVCCIRQPSLGPVFGIKGGAAGGGRSQVLPMEDINLHLTGDAHAVGAANNLLAAYLDNHLYRGNRLGIDRATVIWRRVMDVNDRGLRSVLVGGGTRMEYESGFDITAASEVMAILALSTSYADMRARLGRIIVGRARDGRPVTAEDLKVAGAMGVLLREALKPNLLQTTEGTPAFIHAGPFANIAHGNSSVLADLIATRAAEYVVTEMGFGADLGYEKFCDIKCRVSGLKPDCAVLVATVRALKVHSGKFYIAPGRATPDEVLKEDPEAVAGGAPNLEHHVALVRRSGVPVVVAVNRFPTDTDREIEAVVAAAKKAGADGVEVSEVHARGGEGGRALAEAVVRACGKGARFRHYYELNEGVRRKIEAIATGVYGADGVDYSERAAEKIEWFEKWNLGKLAICMAKTQFSLSHDPKLRGRPAGFRIPIANVRVSAGAGFLYPLCGKMMTMPGLPSRPGGENMDIDGKGNIMGLS